MPDGSDAALDAVGRQHADRWPRLLWQLSGSEPPPKALIEDWARAVVDYPGRAQADLARLIAGIVQDGPAAVLAEVKRLYSTGAAVWHPLDATTLMLLAARLADAAGQKEAAIRCREEAMLHRPFGTLGCSSLASLRMPGPFYLAQIEEIARQRRPASYVEIGVATGDSLRRVTPSDVAIAVDPQPQLASIPPRTQVFTSTSDAFFANHDLGRMLGGRPFDLAFIDGLHHHEQVLKDLRNLERFAGSESVVLLHDSLPVSHWATTRPPAIHFWTGDVWQAVAALVELRPELAVATLASKPSGLTILRGLEPRFAADEALWQRLAEHARQLRYPDYETLTRLVRAVPNDEPTLERLLA